MSAVAEALRRLGIDDLVLIIHERSFPSAPGEDVGVGSPHGRGGRDFLRFVRQLGFTGVQLGPAGLTSRDDPSPYDGTVFSRSPLHIDLLALQEHPWFAPLEPRAAAERLAMESSTRASYRHAFDGYARELGALYQRFVSQRGALGALQQALHDYRQLHAAWLDADGLYDVLCELHGCGDFTAFPAADADLFLSDSPRRGALMRAHDAALEAYALWQLAADLQHADTWAEARALGLQLFGDFQVGYARRDLWRWRSVFLSHFAMGAPPSRTNPEGQPWGYPVLDPMQYDADGSGPGPARALLDRRVERMFSGYDRMRLDHPHGFVCPWVYATSEPDALRAVQRGARLFSSPDLDDHPELARFALVGADQLERSLPRHADGWVQNLEPAQVTRYATLISSIVAAATRLGRGSQALVCEVLSTQPFELGAVMQRFGLGRFRVTQKASLDDPRDVYRSENAAPADWIMLGNHDTPPLWSLLDTWQQLGRLEARAAYLSTRLARSVPAEPLRVAEAQLVDLFLGPARHVMVFFSDLVGERAIYNRPGTVNDDNWTLRLPADYAKAYGSAAESGRAMHLPRILALALECRGLAGDGLAERLRRSPPVE